MLLKDALPYPAQPSRTLCADESGKVDEDGQCGPDGGERKREEVRGKYDQGGFTTYWNDKEQLIIL